MQGKLKGMLSGLNPAHVDDGSRLFGYDYTPTFSLFGSIATQLVFPFVDESFSSMTWHNSCGLL